MSTFNPDHVPPFPILQLEYDGDTVTLDKVIVEPAPGTSATDAGVEAVARKAQTLGLDAVRVRAATPDGTHMMVVSSEGEAIDATPPEASTGRSRNRRAFILITACICAVALTVAGVVIGKSVIASQEEPVAAPAPPIPGEGQTIPVGLPAGFSTEATWAVPIDDGTDPLPLSNGNVLITTADNRLQIIDQKRATAVWSSAQAPNGTKQIVETTWRGRPVLASFSGRQLTLWPLDLPDSTDVQPVSLDAEATGEASFAGTAPLIDLGDYTVAVPAEGTGFNRVTVPPGTQPVAAGTDIIIAVGDNTITHTAITEAGKDASISFDRPKGTRGAPTKAVGLTPTRALLTWETDKSAITAVLDTEHGDILTTLEGSAPSDQTLPQIDAEANTALADPYFINMSSDHPAIVDLDLAASTDLTLAGNHVYTTNGDGALDLAVEGKKVVPEQWETMSDDDPPPSAVSATGAYVVAEKVDTSILYRAPRVSQEK